MPEIKPIPYNGRESYIFISYAHRDIQRVFPIINYLQKKNLRIWFDEGIDPGAEWDENIAIHIDRCDGMIAFISENSINSENCRDELNYSRDNNKDELLIYLEPVNLPRGLALRHSRFQAIHWYNYADPESGYQKLKTSPLLIRNGLITEENNPAQNTDQIKTLSKNGNQFSELFAKAESGDAEAQFSLGSKYIYGKEIEQDYSEAFKWLKLAADQNHPGAQNSLGWCYSMGFGTDKNTEKAVELYQKAVDQGNIYAAHNLGLRYQYGNGVEQNYEKAVRLYQYAADNGHIKAIFQLGWCYRNGLGVGQDNVKAVELYQRAAKEGDSNAQNALAYCYYNGEGTNKDPNEAFRLWMLAAKQGQSFAIKNVGFCYKYGIGVEKDLVEAERWYRKAEEQ